MSPTCVNMNIRIYIIQRVILHAMTVQHDSHAPAALFFDHRVPVVSLHQNRTSSLRCDQLVLLVDAFPSQKVAMSWPHLPQHLALLQLLRHLILLPLTLFQGFSQPLQDLEGVGAWISANGHQHCHDDFYKIHEVWSVE